MKKGRQPGDVVSHYELVTQLGAGGMGIVYKAQDLKLDRYVALKFLPPHLDCEGEEKQRFIQEAKITSAMDHANICTIYEIDEADDGQMFIAMACYDGENLRQKLERGPLSVEEAIRITAQVCEGLAKAHDRGIIHRDIKPDNIVVTEDGVVKIVDFGISKLAGLKGSTQAGTVVGTPKFMSPEQARGAKVDHRTDIWSTGVLLYDMLSCEHPFEGDTDLSIMFCIVNEDPRPISLLRSELPEHLVAVLDRALRKDPDKRFQTAAQFRAEIMSLGTASPEVSISTVAVSSAQPREVPSIAVLPFRDMNPQPGQEYLVEGLAEAVTTNLTRVDGLRVVSRDSVFRLWERQVELAELGRTLGVQNVVQGSLRRAGPRLRVAIQLVDVADGSLSWARDFQHDIDDIFELEDEISRETINVLKSRLAGIVEPESPRPSTSDGEAYTAYLKGRFHWNKRNVTAVKKSIGFFTEAIDADSSFASAFAGLADAYVVLGMYGAFSPEVAMPRAKDAAVRALQIDDRLAGAHVALGCIGSVHGWQWRTAEAEFKRGIELSPNYATGHHWYSVNHLVPLGRFEEALEEINRALSLDPVSLAINATVGLTHYFARDYDVGIEHFKKTLEMDASFPMTNFFLGQAYLQTGLMDEAMLHLRKALDLYGESPNMLATYGYAAGLRGDSDEASEVLDQLMALSESRYVSSYDLARVLLGLGRPEEALKRLQQAFTEKAYLMVYLNVDPILDQLRSASGFQSLAQRVFGDLSG